MQSNNKSNLDIFLLVVCSLLEIVYIVSYLMKQISFITFILLLLSTSLCLFSVILKIGKKNK